MNFQDRLHKGQEISEASEEPHIKIIRLSFQLLLLCFEITDFIMCVNFVAVDRLPNYKIALPSYHTCIWQHKTSRRNHKFMSISKGFNSDDYIFPDYKVVLFEISLG